MIEEGKLYNIKVTFMLDNIVISKILSIDAFIANKYSGESK